MATRDLQLLDIRPIINSIKTSGNTSKGERFQNVTLRPIIKLQNDLFVAVFRNYIAKHKNVFYEFTLEKRLHYIDNALHKDIKFRNSIKGMIIGQFTTEEYLLYIENSSALNKRMMNIVIQRLQSNIQLFEKVKIAATV
ncbi:glyoxalase [Lacinutrix sp. Bg11-31]|uniref:glyoxalase n=1 Tax=Lacinutrix sp. Bg11-31 TaxID=2057808 RepID=UPI000C3176CE|nr:glyoxalase [Lacinutrix sp. Bg11-31]AUC81371.1 glyoxalase [Lacinutrix sp. Bg11-31]